MSCLIFTPATAKLHSHFPSETPSSVLNMIGLWQERETAKGRPNITPESLPSVSELRALYEEVRNTEDFKVTLPKESFEELLDGKELPKQLVSLAERIGVHVKTNKRSHSIEVESAQATKEDLRLFKALAVDLIYAGDKVAETAFGLSPRERLQAVIDYESKNRKAANRNREVMNYELQQAKRVLRDEHGISTDGIMERLRKQAAEAFTSRDRMEHISEITDLFDQILTEAFEDRIDELADRRDELNEYLEKKDQQDFPSWEEAKAAYERELGEIQRTMGSYTRMKALQELGPKEIFDQIRQKFADLAALTGGSDASFIDAVHDAFPAVPKSFIKKNIVWYRDQVPKIVDNFAVLRDEACKELETSELIHIDITYDEALDSSKTEPNEAENTDGEAETDVNGIENQYKENWMYEYDTVSTWSKMSAQVRHMLYKCPLGKRRTRFGTEYKVPVMQVINTLIQEMQGVTNSQDMEFVLRDMQKEYPWTKYILGEISQDSKLKTQLFRSIRRYTQTLGIIQKSSKKTESGDMTKSKLHIVNSGGTTNSILTAAQKQISSGVPLNKKLSIFKDEDLDLDNVDDALEILDEYISEDRYHNPTSEFFTATPNEVQDLLEEYPDFMEDLHKVLQALGFSIEVPDIYLIAARDVRRGVRQKNNLGIILAEARHALTKIKDNGYESISDLINEREELSSDRRVMYSYKAIAQTLTLADTGVVEASIRENGKVRYSFVLPSVLDDLITGFQGKKFSRSKSASRGKRVNLTASEFIEQKFGNDPRFATRNEEGGITYRNYILETLANGTTGIAGNGISYVTVLNVDTARREKTEQKDLTQRDRLNMVWAMYNMEDVDYVNAQGTWYPIPLPSDSGRIGFIRFMDVGEEARREAIKEQILKELERMTDPESDAHLPETFRKNKSRFCTFPVLNDDELASYSKEDVVREFVRAENTGDTSKLDDMLDELVEDVIGAMVEKFKEENEDFYEARRREVGEDVLHDFIVDQSVFQMGINEILNGDPAYYTGYNTGSDNIQKRAKQSIVPLDHIDVFNSDFLESYIAYRGLDGYESLYRDDLTDEELDSDDEFSKIDEEKITERVLYLADPKIPSPSFDDLKSLYLDAINEGIIDQETFDAFIESASSIKYTDGQAFRSFDSMVSMMYALGEMKKGDDLDLALHRIARGEQQPGDSYVVRTALKPFLSGLVPIQENDGTTRLMPVQHKLSEQILTAALVQASGSKLGQSNALSAIAEVMNMKHVDAVIFTSGVKAGNNGAVSFDGMDVEEASKEEIVQRILDEMDRYESATGMDLVHEIPLSLYGIVAQNPDTGMDDSIPIGVQLQKLIAADLPDQIPHITNAPGKKIVTYEKALYPVEGVGDLTRDEILALYNKLMTEKILRAYREVTGTFADRKQLSEALQRACRSSSRNSAYLERAFSLDEYGNFVIPLCDISTLNMSSEFLNSIVKNAVSRIKSPGKQLVSMSAFGLAKDLRIEFERDEDDYPVRYSAIDCLLPAWAEPIIESCVDEKGILDFAKVEKESPELLRAIGVRIPTQFKNFILPLRCVGFLPTILGDTIVTAIDIIVLQDSDFDNDKVPTLFPSFEVQRFKDNWEREAFRDYKEYCDKWYDFELMHESFKTYMEERRARGLSDDYKFEDYYHARREEPDFEDRFRREDAPEGKPVPFWQFKKEHKEDYLRPEGPKLVYVKYDSNKPIEDQSEAAIDNGIISVMYGMMTGKAVSTMALAVGGPEKFDPIIEELKDLVPKGKYAAYDGPADISSRISQETKNNDGKQMIAVFANAEAMQAILQHTGVGLLPGVGPTINGRTLESLHEVQIEDSLEYISRYIGTSVGASADNAKNPRLAVMNVNLRTAPVVSLMLQLGYTMREVALFLNIPSIRHYTDTGDFGDYRMSGDDELLSVLPGGLEEMRKAIRFGDNYEDMDDDMAQYCEDALSVFLYLETLGERLLKLSTLARGDSGGTAPHGPLENNLVRCLNYELFSEMEEEDPVFANWKEVVNYSYDKDVDSAEVDSAKNPLAQAYITYGVVGAFRELSKYYPGIGDPNFRAQVKNIIKKYFGGVATVNNVKSVMYSLYNYMMSSYDCMRKDDLTFEESRNYYLNYFPEEAALLVSSHPEIANSLLFRRLKLYSALETDDNPFITLEYEGTMLPETRDEISAVWQQLFYAKKEDGTPDLELRELALDLFKYSYFRNGLRFGDGTYAHLAPAEARLLFPGYSEMLEDMRENPNIIGGNRFEQQFVRNNLYDGRFCQTVPGEVIKPDGWLKDGIPAETLTIKYRSRMDKTHQNAFEWYFAGDAERDTPRTAFLITQKVKGGSIRYLYYMKVADNDVLGESTYVLTTPLGWKNKAVEYSATEDGLTMPSVFDQEEVATSVRNRYKKRKKKADNTEARSGSSRRSNSSEEPNESVDNSESEKFRGFDTSYFSGEGYKEALELYPEIAKSKKFKEARAAWLKSGKTEKTGKKTRASAKSKEQVAREKKGGNKTDKRFKVIESSSKTGSVIAEEARCAQEIGAYTICITDENSSQLASAIAKAVPHETRLVSDVYKPGNAYSLANQLSRKLGKKRVRSVVLNLTGSYMNTLGKYTSQDDLDSYVLGIYKALKDRGIFVSKVVSTAQPGIPLASARAAMKLGYVLEVHPTADYKMYSEIGSKPVIDKDAFLSNLNAASQEYRKSSRVYDKEEGPFLTAQNKWTREIAAKDKKTLYVFTDNTDRTSGSGRVSSTSRYAKKYGGMHILSYPNATSAVIRGLENAFPLSTQKKYMSGDPKAGQWQDSDLAEFRRTISDEIEDILEAFRSGEYRRVVLPMGGVFGGPLSEITKDRTPKLWKELTKQMEYLSDAVQELAESQVEEHEEEEEETDLKVDNDDTLGKDELQPLSPVEGRMFSNLYLLDTVELSKKGIEICNSSGDPIESAKLFVIISDEDNQLSSQAWERSKVYNEEGKRVIETIKFRLGPKKLVDTLPSEATLGRTQSVKISTKVPYNKAGLTWLDDNNDPIC